MKTELRNNPRSFYLALKVKIEYSLPMMKKVFDFIQKFNMIENKDKIVAGISGGADSVCLLFVLLKLRSVMDIEVIAVHVNHGIRGEAAKEDEEFTVKLCKDNNVKCVVYHENVELIAKKRKQSVEEAGRIVRREALWNTMEQEHADKIAMAHHQNDNAETVLMNLARGSGLKGLTGIRPVNDRVIRPLLCVSRKEIEEYLNSINCSWCNDATNDEDDYTRNRVRHKVIPMLEEQVNSQAVQHINSAARQIMEAWQYMEEQARIMQKNCVREETTGIFQIDQTEFQKCPEALKGILIKNVLTDVSKVEKDISAVHIENIISLFGRQCGRSINLPYSVTAVRNYDGIVLKKREDGQNRSPENEDRNVILDIPGETFLKHKNLTICSRIFEKTEDFSSNQIPQTPYTKWFDYGIINGNLSIRYREPGDSIIINKAGKSQKIKSFFINEKVPAEQRNNVPLLVDEDQVLWIIGYRMSAAAQVTEKTRMILEIKIVEEEKDGREN